MNEYLELLRAAHGAMNRGVPIAQINALIRESTQGEHADLKSLEKITKVLTGQGQSDDDRALQNVVNHSDVSNFARMAVQGASFGMADEAAGLLNKKAILGGIRGAISNGVRGAITGAATNVDLNAVLQSRQRVNDTRRVAPGASALSEIAGAAALPINVAGGLLRSSIPTAAKVAVGAAEGAGLNALNAYGNQEPVGRAALVGAGIGAAVPAVAGAPGAVQRVARAMRRPNVDAIAEKLATSARIPEGAANSTAARKELDAIGEKMFKPLAEEHATVDDPQILEVLKSPDAITAVRKVMRKDFEKRAPSFEELQDIRNKLSDQASRARINGEQSASRSILKTHAELTEAMKARIPGYAEANTAYAGAQRAASAFDKGIALATKRPEVIKAALEKAGTNEARDNMRAGLASYLYDTLSKKGGVVTESMVQRYTSAGMQKRIAEMFATPQDYAAFMSELKAAGKASADRAALKSGFKTALKYAGVGAGAGLGYKAGKSLLE